MTNAKLEKKSSQNKWNHFWPDKSTRSKELGMGPNSKPEYLLYLGLYLKNLTHLDLGGLNPNLKNFNPNS